MGITIQGRTFLNGGIYVWIGNITLTKSGSMNRVVPIGEYTVSAIVSLYYLLSRRRSFVQQFQHHYGAFAASTTSLKEATLIPRIRLHTVESCGLQRYLWLTDTHENLQPQSQILQPEDCNHRHSFVNNMPS